MVYSDHDIFVREMISNGCDAITKLRKLEVMGDYTFPDGYKPAVNVIVDPDQKTLKFIPLLSFIFHRSLPHPSFLKAALICVFCPCNEHSDKSAESEQ